MGKYIEAVKTSSSVTRTTIYLMHVKSLITTARNLFVHLFVINKCYKHD